jgi:hypothetical protein
MKTDSASFAGVHARLRDILAKYERRALAARTDKPDSYILVGPPTPASVGREVWFGAVETRKSYVSYHLMAVYAFPDLLEGMTPELKKRMQGKSCFNFGAIDERLFKELARLTERGYRRFRKAGLIE